jgi:protein NrfD
MSVEHEQSAQSQYGPQREMGIHFQWAEPSKLRQRWPERLEQPYQGETYYNKPALKSTHYRWLITTYFFVGGLASAAQFIATVGDLMAGREQRKLVRIGRYLALLGALASPILLIADLRTPRRWFNMLRIYRPTSAMSIGSWALSAFGGFTGVTALAQALDDLGLAVFRPIARIAQLPAALAGAVVALYTGTLLAATNSPFLASTFPFLSPLFASSAVSTATAALSIAAEASNEPSKTKRWLNAIAFISGLSELIFALLIQRDWRRRNLAEPFTEEPIKTAYRVGVLGLGITGPLVVHGIEAIRQRDVPVLSILASCAMLIGGYILRAVFVFEGNRSTLRPEEYFRFTQPTELSGGPQI